MNSCKLDLLEAVDIHLNVFNETRIKPNKLCKELKYKNPLLYHHLTPTDVKADLKQLYPLYKNVRRKTKIFKISKKRSRVLRDISACHIRPFHEVNLKFYGIQNENKKVI